MILTANGLGESIGAETRYFLESEARAGRDDEVVITQFLPIIERKLGMLSVNLSDGIDQPIDAFVIEGRLHRYLSLLGRAPPHCDPGIRGGELKIRPCADQGHAVAFCQMLAQIECRRNSA